MEKQKKPPRQSGRFLQFLQKNMQLQFATHVPQGLREDGQVQRFSQSRSK